MESNETKSTSQKRRPRGKAKSAAQTQQRRGQGRSGATSARGRAPARPAQSRKFRLQPDEAVSDGIRRIIEGQIDGAVDHLAQEDAEPVDEAVHEARKGFKRIRATLRLARGGLATETFRLENERFRELGRELSGARDADVVVEALGQLIGHFESEVAPGDITELPALLHAEQAERRSDLVDGSWQQKGVTERLGVARKAVAGLTLESEPSALLTGLRQTYRAGRKAFAAARKDSSDETLHEWRKRVKDLWHQLQVLESVWPKPMRAAAAEAHRLAELLGQDHDLVVLAGRALENRERIPSAERDLVANLIERRRAQLQAEAMGLGSRIYAEAPKQFTARIGAYLRVASADEGAKLARQ